MSISNSMTGGGFGKSVDSVVESVKHLVDGLKSANDLVASMGKNASSLDGVAKAVASGKGTSASSVGNATFGALGGMTNNKGVAGATFGGVNADGSYAGPMPSFGSASAADSVRGLNEAGGGGGRGGGGIVSAATRHFGPAGGVVAAVGAGAVSTIWTGLPNIDETLAQRQSLFRATIDQSSMPDYKAMKREMMNAFDGYATSVSSQENVAALAKSYGVNVGSGQFARVAENSSVASRITGMSNEAAAQAEFNVGSASTSNRLLNIGIKTTAADGTTMSMQDTVKEVVRKSFGGKTPTKEQLDRALAPDGRLRLSLESIYGSDAPEAIALAQAQAANGGESINNKAMDKLGFNTAKRNAAAAQQEATGEHSETVAEYSDKMVEGWELALKAANAVENSLQDLSTVLGGVAAAKGGLQGLDSTPGGSALLNGLTTTGMGIGAASLISGTNIFASMGKGIFGAGKSVLGGAGKVASGTVGEGVAARVGGGTVARTALGAAARAAGPLAAAYGLSEAKDWLVDKNISKYSNLGYDEGTSRTRRVGSAGAHFLARSQKGLFGTISAVGGLSSQGLNYGTDASWKGDFGGEGSTGGNNVAAVDAPKASSKTSKAGGTNAKTQRAVNFALQTKRWSVGMCDNFVGNCWGHSASGYASAIVHWNQTPAKYKHTGTPPPGALVFFRGGRYGHVALSLGGNKARSTDFSGGKYVPNVVGTGSIQDIAKAMGHAYLGWTEPYYFGKVEANVLGGSGSYGTADPASVTTKDEETSASEEAASGATSRTAGSPPSVSSGSAAYADANGSIKGANYSISGSVTSTTLGRLGKAGQANSARGEPATGDTKQGSAPDTGATSTSSAGGAPKVSGTSGVERWRSTIESALKANGLPASSAYVDAWLRQVKSESGGNEKITQQIKDVNSGGNEAQGLLQVIPPTFKSYMFPGHDDIHNGYDNALAAINYAKTRYGSKMLKVIGQGHGYQKGSYDISEDQVADLHQGEMVVPAGMATEVRRAVAEVVSGQRSGSDKIGGSGRAANQKVEINLIANGDLRYDARQLAREVQRILNDDAELALIGKS